MTIKTKCGRKGGGGSMKSAKGHKGSTKTLKQDEN